MSSVREDERQGDDAQPATFDGDSLKGNTARPMPSTMSDGDDQQQSESTTTAIVVTALGVALLVSAGVLLVLTG